MNDDDHDIDLPEMGQAFLDPETYERYFRDLQTVADVRHIRVKGSARAHSDDATVTLETARDMLASGAARGIQIRYLWQGEVWWDTLIRKSKGIEITRIQPPE